MQTLGNTQPFVAVIDECKKPRSLKLFLLSHTELFGFFPNKVQKTAACRDGFSSFFVVKQQTCILITTKSKHNEFQQRFHSEMNQASAKEMFMPDETLKSANSHQIHLKI